MDSKSIGLCPQGFKSPRCRFARSSGGSSGSKAATVAAAARAAGAAAAAAAAAAAEAAAEAAEAAALGAFAPKALVAQLGAPAKTASDWRLRVPSPLQIVGILAWAMMWEVEVESSP